MKETVILRFILLIIDGIIVNDSIIRVLLEGGVGLRVGAGV